MAVLLGKLPKSKIHYHNIHGLWNAELDLTGSNNHKIVVRATDKTGKIQTDQIQDPFPNGATGYHMINV